MRRVILILTVAALMAPILAFGSSGVAFAQVELAVAIVADDLTEDEKCAELVANYEEFIVEDSAEEMAEVAEEIEYCLSPQIAEGQEE